MKTPERRRSGVLIVNFKHISHLFQCFFVEFEQVNVSWVIDKVHSFVVIFIKIINLNSSLVFIFQIRNMGSEKLNDVIKTLKELITF